MSNDNTAVATRADRETLDAILKRPAYLDRFKEVLGERAPQFCSSILSVGRTMPDVEPKSIVAAAMIAATLDLPIEKNLGFAWIVAYKDGGTKYAQFQMGYKGYVQLAQRTGRYQRMNACPVNEEALDGFDEVGEPKINFEKLDPAKPAVGYFFGWKLTNGFVKMCYWSREKVVEHAKKYSKAYKAAFDGPWKTEFDKMAQKTVVANELSDWGVLSVEWQKARKFDQAVVTDIDAEAKYVDNDQPQLNEGGEEKRLNAPAATAHTQSQAAATAPAAAASTTKSAAEQAKETDTKRTSKPKTAKPAAEAPAAPAAPAEPAKPAESAAPAAAAEPTAAEQAAALPAGELPDAKYTERVEGEDDKAYAVRMYEGVTKLLGANEISPEQFMPFAVQWKFAQPGQKLKELASSKHVSFITNWPKLFPKIQKLIASAK